MNRSWTLCTQPDGCGTLGPGQSLRLHPRPRLSTTACPTCYCNLRKKNSKYILLRVSDVPKASLILERQFHVKEYSVQDEQTLWLYDTTLDMAAINKALVVQDVAVISSQLCNDTLEDYFKRITGGEGIA